MANKTVQYTVIVKPCDPQHGCEHYIHASFYPRPEAAMADALAAWNVDEPETEGEVSFVSPGLGWDPRMGPRPEGNEHWLFRNTGGQ